MNCKQIHNNLIFYLGHELSDEKMEAIGRHINTCADCRQFAEMMKQQLQLIDDEKKPEVSPYFYTRLSTRFDENYKSAPAFIPVWMQTAAFTILLAASIAGGIYLGTHTSAPAVNSAENNLLLMNDFETEPIETFLLNQQ